MGKSEIRKDSKGRILKNGESQAASGKYAGRYRYQYQDEYGNRASVFSWTLTKNDTVPKDKSQKGGESLREKEDRISVALNNRLQVHKGNMSLYELAEIYVNKRWKEVRESTRKGYMTQLKFLKNQAFAKRKITDILPLEAEDWLYDLHEVEGKNFSSLHTLKGVLKKSYVLAIKNLWAVYNPFDFSLNKKKLGGEKMRDAVTRNDMRRFLDFLRTDKHFSKYFNGVYILFNTGLRISEFCGLTVNDIDFENHVIHVRRQLLRVHTKGEKVAYYIEEPKSLSGTRDIPMFSDVEEAFHDVIANRPQLLKEPVVWDENHNYNASGFLWFDKDKHLEVAQHWQNHFRWAVQKFNNTYKQEIPSITPHVCRHTFCSNCAVSGMSPKILQVIMGHSTIEMTLNHYTHVQNEKVMTDFTSMVSNKNYDLYPFSRIPETVALNDDDYEEGTHDLDEMIDEID